MSGAFTVEPAGGRPFDRRIVRIALVGDPVKSARRNLGLLKTALQTGQATPQQQARALQIIERIESGESPEAVIGETVPREKPKDPDRVTMIALDCCIRSLRLPRPSKIVENVAHDWRETSVSTVKGIHRSQRASAMGLIAMWLNSEATRSDFDPQLSMHLLTDAVISAREQILAGSDRMSATKTSKEVVELTLFLGHVMSYYCDRGAIQEATWHVDDELG